MSEAVLRAGCEKLGLDQAPMITSKMLILKEFLLFYGRSMNLTGPGGEVELNAHLLEGLQVVALARRLGVGGRWLDVGSGGGFPALILAACLEDLELVLVEPRAKRASILELGLAKLGRQDARVIRGRVEGGSWRAIDGQMLEPGFDAASARAVFSPERWVAEATPWVKPGGLICLHLNLGDDAPEGTQIVGRVDGDRWSTVGVRSVPRGTSLD